MPIVVTCPGCPTKLSAPDNAVGKQVRCPKCSASVPVPAPEPEEPVVDATPAPKTKPKPVDDDDDDRPRKKSRRDDDDDDDEPPRKKARRRDDDDEDERPRKKKKKKSYADDDDDYEHDHPRRKRRPAKSGGSGVFVFLIIGGLLLLILGGVAIYFVAGKGGLFTKKAPPPPGWQQHTSNGGVKLYLPTKPRTDATVAVNGPDFGGPGFGFGRRGPMADELRTAESVSVVEAEAQDGSSAAMVMTIRFRDRVPVSLRDKFQTSLDQALGRGDARKIRWLGSEAFEVTTKDGLGTVRGVCVDRTVVIAIVGSPRGGRTTKEVEEGFFDNIELTK